MFAGVSDGRQTLKDAARRIGAIEDHQDSLTPERAVPTPSHALNLHETPAPQVEFAVQRHGGQSDHEPIWREDDFALTSEQLLTSPQSAPAVELLLSQPAAHVLPGVVSPVHQSVVVKFHAGRIDAGGGGWNCNAASDLEWPF